MAIYWAEMVMFFFLMITEMGITMKTLIKKIKSRMSSIMNWCRNNNETLLLIGVGLLLQLIFFFGILLIGAIV